MDELEPSESPEMSTRLIKTVVGDALEKDRRVMKACQFGPRYE